MFNLFNYTKNKNYHIAMVKHIKETYTQATLTNDQLLYCCKLAFNGCDDLMDDMDMDVDGASEYSIIEMLWKLTNAYLISLTAYVHWNTNNKDHVNRAELLLTMDDLSSLSDAFVDIYLSNHCHNPTLKLDLLGARLIDLVLGEHASTYGYPAGEVGGSIPAKAMQNIIELVLMTRLTALPTQKKGKR